MLKQAYAPKQQTGLREAPGRIIAVQGAGFNVEIRQSSACVMTPDERQIIARIAKRAFVDYDTQYWGKFEWAPADWQVFGMLEGVPVCHAKLTKRKATADDKQVTIIGMGGLKTDPDHQGRGFAGRLMSAIRDFIMKEGADLGLLVCGANLVPFYEKCGWQAFRGELLVQCHGQQLVWPERTMLLAMEPTGPLPNRIDLCGPPF